MSARGWLLPFAVWICMTAAAESSRGMRLYPSRAGNVYNLRLAKAFPEGARGRCLPAFGFVPYRIGDVLGDLGRGEIVYSRRGYARWRKDADCCLRLRDPRHTNVIVRLPGLKTKDLHGAWAPCRATWGEGRVDVAEGTGTAVCVAAGLPHDWRPGIVEVDGYAVDELSLTA